MTKKIIFAHSPDPDDAFMFYGFEKKAATIPGYTIEHHLDGIHELNIDAYKTRFPLTAISAFTYPFVAENYQIMPYGMSIGDGYGPIVVGRHHELSGLQAGRTIAIPGETTTAFLVFRLFFPDLKPIVVPFDEILGFVEAGRADYGLLIHEGQLTWKQHAVKHIVDLGVLWKEKTGLPLPLGLDVVQRSLDTSLKRQLAHAFEQSINYAFQHEDEAMTYARAWGRGIEVETNKKFIRMYVNDHSRNFGEIQSAALKRLYKEAFEAGLIPSIPAIDPVEKGDASQPMQQSE